LTGRGNAKSPISVSSEMNAGNYRLTAQVRTGGEHAAAEWVLSGERDATSFHGVTLGFGGPSALAIWDYRAAAEPAVKPGGKAIGDSRWHSVEILRKDARLRIVVDGKTEFEIDDPRHRRRVSPALYLFGEGADVRVKALKIEPLD
jgi:hypothetical protein